MSVIDKRLLFKGVPRVDINLIDAGPITKEVKLNASITMTNANSSAFTSSQLHNQHCTIKGRGNTTWTLAKKPYNIGLTNNSNVKATVGLFGMPSSADWTLLACYQDKTFLRSAFSVAVAYALGQPWASRGQHIELYLGGVYQGIYFLCEKVDVGTNKINITKVGTADNTLPNLSGGYVIEKAPLYQINTGAGEKYFTDSTSQTWTFKVPDPDKVTDTQVTFMQGQWNDFLSRLYDQGFDDLVNGYRAVIDPLSFAQYFLLRDLAKDADAYVASWYITKDRNGVLKAGPGWDWDACWGAIADENFGGDPLTVDFSVAYDTYIATVAPYYAKLMTDPYFYDLLKSTYQNGLLAVNQVLEDVEAFVPLFIATGAPARDRAKWPDILADPIYLPQDTYQEEVDRFKSFIRDRLFYHMRRIYFPIAEKPAFA